MRLKATHMNKIKTPAQDHHLWNNNGTYWSHFTLHLPDYTKERLRLSLDTQDLNTARARRDSLIQLFGPLLAGQKLLQAA